MKKPKDQMVFARVDKELADKLARLAIELDRPASQIVRDGLRREIAQLTSRKGEKHEAL